MCEKKCACCDCEPNLADLGKGETMEIKVFSPDFMPKRATDGAAGYDLFARLEEKVVLFPGDVAPIPTGVSFWIKRLDYCGLVFSRSGWGKVVVTLGNSVGVIDSDYLGEVVAFVTNKGRSMKEIAPKERFCQIVFVNCIHPFFEVREEFSGSTARGEGGFGHSGRF